MFAPGERFAYNNSGFVVLALIAERVSGIPFERLVRGASVRARRHARHGVPALRRTGRVVPPSAISTPTGYRTNVLHLPVLGSGDGGIYSTAADLHAFWMAMFSGRIVSTDCLAEMVRPRSDVPSESRRYGLGFWLHRSSRAVMLEGLDAGVSFRSLHDPDAQLTYTVLSNTTEGAWPIARHLDEHLAP